ncbi:hypothetical protein MTP02_40010 [Streptomyces albus]|nr:hypothetical protein MTP02_40010 [Streptomyces albus]
MYALSVSAYMTLNQGFRPPQEGVWSHSRNGDVACGVVGGALPFRGRNGWFRNQSSRWGRGMGWFVREFAGGRLRRRGSGRLGRLLAEVPLRVRLHEGLKRRPGWGWVR